MGKYFSSKYSGLTPYTPGEQPKDQQYIKLNTNESPFPPSPHAVEYAAKAAESCELYSDPECRDLVSAAASYYGFEKDEILFTNGSDEILNFAFMAFCDEQTPAVFPDITYGFYPVFASLNGVPYEEKPLTEGYGIRVEDYIGVGKTVFIANPNAPTGIALSLDEIERIVKGNPGNVVVIDEAYVDFGGESAVGLIHKYDNLLVTQTFSKSRSLAGARLGCGIACKELIRDLNTVKYSTNPYNINRMTMAAGIGSYEDDDYFRSNCEKIASIRADTVRELNALGFSVLPSSANFVFASHPRHGGKELYRLLKQNGILVRHFDKPRLDGFLRITIGSEQQMKALLKELKKLTEEKP